MGMEKGTIMVEVKVKQEWTKQPVSSYIFGNFIESGFGRQVNGMWSEMLYNRAFRDVPAYKAPTWEWLGLDEEHYNSEAPFWHSGYEENDWQLIGTPVKSYTCGTHTYKGTTSLLLENTDGRSCGLKQKGLHLEKEKVYQFRIFAGIRADLGEAGINGFCESIHGYKKENLIIRIGEQETCFSLTAVPRLYEWDFKAKETQIADIIITFDFSGTLILAFASLMPGDNLKGWRIDVVEKLKQVSPSIVRFPGGCFVSFFNWENSIGNRDRREPQPSFYWGGLEENDVGLDEFLSLSKLVGFTPQICFNMMTSEPFKARQLVEYLNSPENVGMGRLRMLNGVREPYGVKFFEMDNEPGRKWTACQYAQECVAFAREMRLADPSIELMMAAYSYEPELLPEMLDIAGKDIQYVIYREGNPEFVHNILRLIRDYNTKNNTCLKLVNTEWLSSCRSIEPYEDIEIPQDFRWNAEITNNYKDILSTYQIGWNYALNGAHRLLDYISYGGEFALANFNNMCNTWGQNIIESTKDSCYLSCMGIVFSMFAETFEPCYAAETNTEDDRIFALYVKTVSDKIQLYLINHSVNNLEVQLPEGSWYLKKGLKGTGRMEHETYDKSCVKILKSEPVNTLMTVPGLSFLCLVHAE